MVTAARTLGVGKPGNADVYVMNVDGAGLRDVTQSVIWDSATGWEPKVE